MKKNQKFIYVALVIVYILLSNSCSKRQADEIVPQTTNPGGGTSTVTYTNFTQALIQTKCAGCHGAGRSAASIWTFNGLASITSNETRIRRVVLETKSMPIGGSLTAAELASLKEWFDNKMPN
ncbi:cytochrome c [Pedobacter sp. R20-19]|uniref:c-type cytochrome n=1 Tax=Pedobacter sp. R20-19 TaxID=1270196 RepID=UPI0004931C06|nr:cytochrome c [Pedobacter sp. R20-19]